MDNKAFDPSDSYWIVGGSTTMVYSSKRNIYVPTSDAGYLAWKVSSGAAPIVPNEATIWYYVGGLPAFPSWLFNGMTFSQPAEGLFTVPQLIAYANVVQWAKAIGGHVVTIDGDPVPFSTSPDSMNFLSGKVQRLQQPNPPAAVNWQIGTSTFKEIPASEFILAATEIADFIQSTFDLLDTVFGEIKSDPPTITTTQQVDAAFA